MALTGDMSEFSTLVDIIARLRSPEGCPWDRQQTHSSLREHFLEETYEVLEALDEQDMTELRQELGDLLMHIVFQVQIASETGEFKLGDVLTDINTKLIRRHPHVFGKQKVKDAGEVALHWEALKKEERGDASLLETVPKNLPALAYGQEIQHRAARVGFDWPDVAGVIDKLGEEVSEFRQAASQEERAKEFGDLLFTLANIARRMGIDLETSLREANKRFYKRFSYMEQMCRERGLKLNELSLDEQNALWEEAKERVGS